MMILVMNSITFKITLQQDVTNSATFKITILTATNTSYILEQDEGTSS